jgi:tRNA pseudouridine38-40 synthase
VTSAHDAPPGFHARFSARGKLYRYAILVRRLRCALLERTHWRVGAPLDVEAMRAAARGLVGRHDFAAFGCGTSHRGRTGILACSTDRKVGPTARPPGMEAPSTVREIQRFEVREQLLTGTLFNDASQGCRQVLIEVAGTSFLYKMVRTLAGSLVEVGRGARPAEWLKEVLESKDRTRAGPTAPPHGLCLVEVFY